MQEYNWKHWISEPKNRKLYDENPKQALREYNAELGRRANMFEYYRMLNESANNAAPAGGASIAGTGILYREIDNLILIDVSVGSSDSFPAAGVYTPTTAELDEANLEGYVDFVQETRPAPIGEPDAGEPIQHKINVKKKVAGYVWSIDKIKGANQGTKYESDPVPTINEIPTDPEQSISLQSNLTADNGRVRKFKDKASAIAAIDDGGSPTTAAPTTAAPTTAAPTTAAPTTAAP